MAARIPWSALIAAVLLLTLFEYLFFLPLRPTAWSGPRDRGPFETSQLPAAGRWSREARLQLEAVANWRSPGQALEATAEALAAYHALLTAARYAVLWWALCRRCGSGWLAAVAVVATALPLAFGAPRQTETDVGLLLFVVLMAATSGRTMTWLVATMALPGLFALWANTHCSVVVGVLWLAALAGGRAIEWVQAWRTEDADLPQYWRYLLALLLCIAAACVNPDGPRIFVDAFAVTKNPNVGSLPAWQPIDFSKGAGLPWVYFATLAIMLVVQVASPAPWSPTALLIVLSFGIWPLVQQRGQDYWWPIAAWLIVPQLTAALGRRRAASAALAVPASRSMGRWLLIVMGVALVATPAARWLITGQPRTLGSIVSVDTPVRLSGELHAPGAGALPDLAPVLVAYPSGRYRGAILSGEEQGDFLAWVLDGDNARPIMMYTRPEAIDRSHWDECRRALAGNPDWWEILGRHQVNVVVINAKQWPKLAELLRNDSEWRTVQDDVLLVSVRCQPKLPVELMGP